MSKSAYSWKQLVLILGVPACIISLFYLLMNIYTGVAQDYDLSSAESVPLISAAFLVTNALWGYLVSWVHVSNRHINFYFDKVFLRSYLQFSTFIIVVACVLQGFGKLLLFLGVPEYIAVLCSMCIGVPVMFILIGKIL